MPFSAQAARRAADQARRQGRAVRSPSRRRSYSLVTKSANDFATALGELLGGSRAEFRPHDDRQGPQPRHDRHHLPERQRPARSRPAHHRARHGHPGHRAARAFPAATTAISRPARSPTATSRIANHNRLLGRIKGVDGIKTGYTRASGFNLVSSVSDGDRRIVAVVMGGASGGSRDAQMAELIRQYLPKASAQGGGDWSPRPASADRGDRQAILPKRNRADAGPAPQGRSGRGADEIEVIGRPRKRRSPPRPPNGSDAGGRDQLRSRSMQAYAEPMRRPEGRPSTGSTPRPAAIRLGDPGRLLAERGRGPRLPGRRPQARRQAPLPQASPFTVPFEKDGTTFYRARFGGFASRRRPGTPAAR